MLSGKRGKMGKDENKKMFMLFNSNTRGKIEYEVGKACKQWG